MLRPRHHNRLAAWVTLFTLVLAMLAPTVSRAMALVQGSTAPWSLVCSAARDGNAVAVSPLELSTHAIEHCPLCSLQGDPPALPMTAAMGSLTGVFTDAVPASWAIARDAHDDWSWAQARAPPRHG